MHWENPYRFSLQVEEWITKANGFVDAVKKLRAISKRLVELPNFSATQELFPYVWDLLGVLETCAGYVSWLGKNLLKLSAFLLEN